MYIDELPVTECKEILVKSRLGRLACSRENQPYIVPLHFVFDGEMSLYAFSTFGQKIDWMRANPKVCVEIDEIKNQFEWSTLIIFGRYEELLDKLEFHAERQYAHGLLSQYPMWWQPAFVAGANRSKQGNDDPIYFRIKIESISGHRAVEEKTAV